MAPAVTGRLSIESQSHDNARKTCHAQNRCDNVEIADTDDEMDGDSYSTVILIAESASGHHSSINCITVALQAKYTEGTSGAHSDVQLFAYARQGYKWSTHRKMPYRIPITGHRFTVVTFRALATLLLHATNFHCAADRTCCYCRRTCSTWLPIYELIACHTTMLLVQLCVASTPCTAVQKLILITISLRFKAHASKTASCTSAATGWRLTKTCYPHRVW